jgi:UDP-N-acetylglucosamine/UDP-N-acetylgalactosamine 4-epimerase
MSGLLAWVDDVVARDLARPRRWLITGAAGFIGSNLAEALLLLDQEVVGLDNFVTGHRHNIDAIIAAVGSERATRFRFVEADICDAAACDAAVAGVDIVLHQAALGSVPRSILEPVRYNANNVDGYLNMLDAARRAGVEAFVYASSSSVYGDEPTLPKQEDRTGRLLSPYALGKWTNELYADVYARTYDFGSVGLRYFNAFGQRQDPEGAYAAVIPKWTAAMIAGEPVLIHGDGETSRDFCYIANVVQANIRAALYGPAGQAHVLNVAAGAVTTLNQLFDAIRDILADHQISYRQDVTRGPFRAGDIRHSLAALDRAASLIGYQPTHHLRDGLALAMPHYIERARAGRAAA